ncbi:MAG: NINE protein [Candidatus Firestonebacteria bacterium RIFOXYA2_FULL_40_8]|nr:MAG: NINE protein [Candidatus Firestonebacteria bacterium RIFOXYA2_FULL_40_8]
MGSNDLSDKKRLLSTLLCFFFGVFGAHRFYAGKIGTGILWLCTIGFLGVGAFIDLIIILFGEFKDNNKKKIIIWV